MAADLNTSIGNTVTSLNTLRNYATDATIQKQIQTLLTEVYFPLWQQIIQQALDATTAQYKDASAQLDSATKAANDAVADISKTAAAIATAVKAAKAVDQVVGAVLPVLALL